MSILEIMLRFGMPPYGEPRRRPARPDAIRVQRVCDPVQVGPVNHSNGVAFYDCPCGCGLWTSTPAQRCGELKPATHWDTLVDTCGDCAGEAYGE
jgi:hypothetical protein